MFYEEQLCVCHAKACVKNYEYGTLKYFTL